MIVADGFDSVVRKAVVSSIFRKADLRIDWTLRGRSAEV